MTRKLTREEYIEKATKLHKGRYTYENTVYIRSADKIEVECLIHGPFKVTANNHVSLSNLCGCPSCYGNKKISVTDFLNKANIVHNNRYDYSKVIYKDSQTHVVIICSEHGEFNQTPTRHLAGRGCHNCGGTKRQKIEQLIQKAVNVHEGFYDYSKVEKGARASDNVSIVCPTHGSFEQKLKLHINREYGCPKCGQKSKPEAELLEFLKLYTTVESRNRKLIAPKEIDIWLPEHNIGIEYHGLYWHTEKRVGNLHRVKWEMAEKAGIRLIQIFEDEWANKQEIVKQRLLALIGEAKTYNARSLLIKQITINEARCFLEATHIQGAGVASLYYALYEKDNIVAVATFGKSRTGGMAKTKVEGEWEVVRYASIGRVRGGFSKLLKRFIQDINPKVLISYCDLRYGDGKLYQTTGFTLDKITVPDYWWLPKEGKRRVPRYTVQKHQLAKESHELYKYYAKDKTEKTICEEAGWQKIYGVGNQKWVWTK